MFDCQIIKTYWPINKKLIAIATIWNERHLLPIPKMINFLTHQIYVYVWLQNNPIEFYFEGENYMTVLKFIGKNR